MSEIDRAIGARIRRYRQIMGLSQSQLADQIGVTFQQVQKYENGANRVAASRLWFIAETLGISIASLFRDIQPEAAASELLDLFYRLPEDRQAEALDHMRAFAGNVRQPVGTES